MRIGCFLFVKILIHFTQGFSCVVWLKLSQWFWRRFLKFRCISLFHYYLPLEDGIDPSFLFAQGCSVPSLIEIGRVVLVKKISKLYQITSIFAISSLSPLRNLNPFYSSLGRVYLKLARGLYGRFLKFHECIFDKSLLSLHGPSFEHIKGIPFSQRVWFELAQWFWRRRRKCEMFTTTTSTTDKFRLEKLT